MTDEQATVLVVDDEKDLADLYAAWLSGEYDVRTAYGGDEALEKLDGDVDVALIDRLMPDLSGDEVLAAIRERGYDCRVAMVTAVEPDFDIVGMGFDDYLVKPVDSDGLLRIVDQLLTRDTYDEQLRALYALASKRAALGSQKSQRELEDSDAYADLTERIERLRDDLDETVADLDERDFEMALRQIGSDEDGEDDQF